MSDLMLSLDELEDLAGRLRVIEDAFSEATSISRGVASAVGHAGLAGAVLSFAGSWDDRRRKIVEAMNTIASTTEAIAEAFRTVDNSMGSELRKAGG